MWPIITPLPWQKRERNKIVIDISESTTAKKYFLLCDVVICGEIDQTESTIWDNFPIIIFRSLILRN